MINDLLRWRQEATKEDWSRLAQLAQTSTGYLDQLAYGYRRASPQMAESIEKGTKLFKGFKSVSKERLVFAELKTKAA